MLKNKPPRKPPNSVTLGLRALYSVSPRCGQQGPGSAVILSSGFRFPIPGNKCRPALVEIPALWPGLPGHRLSCFILFPASWAWRVLSACPVCWTIWAPGMLPHWTRPSSESQDMRIRPSLLESGPEDQALLLESGPEDQSLALPYIRLQRGVARTNSLQSQLCITSPHRHVELGIL